MIKALRTSFANSLRAVGAMFRPPFDGLWLLATLYVVWCFLMYPNSPVVRGDLPDTDDYTYLTQVLDWMQGQGWYDNVQYRLDPPNGVPIHFSRLAQLPMAAIIWLFERLGLGPRGAANFMAIIYPPMLLACLFGALRWTARSVMPVNWAGVTAFTGLFAINVVFYFQPGHVDHHGLNLIILTLGLGCLMRLLADPENPRWPLGAGLLMALSLVIALEALPWLLVIAAYLGLIVAWRGGAWTAAGMLFGLVLFVGSALGLAVTRPPHDWLNPDILSYSVAYVLLTAGIAAPFAAAWLLRRAQLVLRLVVSLIVALLGGGLFLTAFPELWAGPYGGIDPVLVKIILNEITEAQPLKGTRASWFDMTWLMGGAWIAYAASVVFIKRTGGAERLAWGLWLLMQTATLGLVLFYQRRYIGSAMLLTIIPMAVMLQRGWGWVGARYRGRRQFAAELALILLVGPLPAVLYPALMDGRSFNYGILFFPVVLSPEATACQSYTLENALRMTSVFGDKPLLIMNPMGAGPELLFRTKHKVLSAPYHMNVQGNVDSTRFFSTPYPEEAEAIARRRKIDLVISCAFASDFYFRARAWGKQAGVEEGPGKDFAPHFIERLMTGHIPVWLQPVKVPGLKNYVIYRVLPENEVPKSAAK